MSLARTSLRFASLLAALLLGAISLRAQETGSNSKNAFREARQLYRDGKLTEALAAFQQFESQYPLSASAPQAIYLQGWCWTGLHKYSEAIDIFGRLIKTYPTVPIIPEVILKQADCYRELKNYSKALDLYRQFETQYPKHLLRPQAMLGEAWVLFQQNDRKTASEIAQDVRVQFPGDTVASLDALFLLGQILTAEKNYDAADEAYRQITSPSDNPRAAEDLYLAGEAMFDAKRYINAITYYERAQSDPNIRAAALFRAANCYQFLDCLEEATAAYRQFLKTYPNDKLAEPAQFALIQVLTERHEPTEAESESHAFQEKYPNSAFATDVLFLQAEALFASGQFQEAVDRFQKFSAAGKNPQLLETAGFRIAVCYDSLQDYNRARDGFSAFLRKYPNSKSTADALFHLANCDLGQTNLSNAVNNYELIHTKFPNYNAMPDVVFQLGTLYRSLSPPNIDKSLAMFQEFVNRWPDNPLVPEALYQIARNQFAQSKFTDAIAAWQRLLDKYPDHPLAPSAAHGIAASYLAVGDTMLRRDQFARARDAYRKSLTLYPHDNRATLRAQIGLGKACLALTQLDDAEKAFNAVITTDPHNADVELGLARIYLARDQGNAQTVDLLTNVLANSQGNNAGEAAFLLGNYFFNLRDNAKENKNTALAYYLRASLMTSGPDGEEAAFRIAQCHKALGDMDAARSAFQGYLRRFPKGKLATDAKQELALL